MLEDLQTIFSLIPDLKFYQKNQDEISLQTLCTSIKNLYTISSEIFNQKIFLELFLIKTQNLNIFKLESLKIKDFDIAIN